MPTPRKGETQEQCRERENVRRRERYATDPEYRERTLGRTLERKRERYARDPEYRERTLERKRSKIVRTLFAERTRASQPATTWWN
jgi:hypothetical protein